MKIAIIGTAYPFRGGLAAYNERLAKELQDQGHEVTIYTFSLQYPSILFPGKSQLSEEPAPEHLNIIENINSINPFNWFRTGRKIKKQKPDLVIIKFWIPFMGPCFGTILKRIRRNRLTKVLTIIDNIIPHESRPGDRLLTKYFVRRVDAFIAMSNSVLGDINQFDRNKPRLYSPHPLFDNFGNISPKNEALAKLGLDQDKEYILFFGFIRDYKGLDLLLKAFADKRFRGGNIRLIIAGEYYTNREPYDKLIHENNLESEISHVDKFITDSEVADYFNASDLVVQPYKSATQSGVTQIAYHFDKPMIVTDVGGLAEMCPHGKVGYVVNPDPKEIAEAIMKFFNDANREEMVANITEIKKKYSWEVLTDSIYTLVNQLK